MTATKSYEEEAQKSGKIDYTDTHCVNVNTLLYYI